MAGENPEFAAWVRTLPCRMYMHDPCWPGNSEAHHAGPRGLGQKAHDLTCIPLCRKHHQAWHDANGPFKTWKRADRAAWAERQIAWVQALWRKTCAA